MLKTIQEDIQAVKRNDPAAHGWLEIVLCHPPLHAILVHRMAHWIYTRLGLRLLARLIAVANRFWTGVEIHPGARIGRGFFIDHPIVGNHVFIGTNAILLGPIRVGDHAKVGANAFVINRDVPASCTVVGTPARIVRRFGERVDEELPRTVPPSGAVPVELEL